MAKFEIGQAAGPGRPVGSVSGRRQALSILDKVFSKTENKKALEADLQTEFSKSPGAFFRRYSRLIPRELLLQIEKEEELDIQVKITPGIPDALQVRQELHRLQQETPDRLLTLPEAVSLVEEICNSA